MRRIYLCVCFFIFLLNSGRYSYSQSPSLFMSAKDFELRKQVAEREPWAKLSLDGLIKEANDFPGSYEQRFGLDDSAPPPEGGQWLHWYACPGSGRPLQFRPPDKNICPDTGKNYSGYPYDHVVYQLRNDALAEASVALGLAFQFTHKAEYAKKAADILKAYARVYPTYSLHDNYGKATPNGARAYSQTLDESIWLIKIAWTYDLIRGAGVLTTEEKHDIEADVLRASVATVIKAHKEPTYNIQSWINGAEAAVGFTLDDQHLIDEAIDGPIGFRYQMHHFVTEGFWAEGAWGYQFYAMRPLTMTAQMAARKGMNLWKEEPNLDALFHSPLGVVLPDGKLPAFNDSESTDLYNQNYLYEVAYAATRDRALLTVIEHGPRTDREALLFGTEHLPSAAPPKLVSEVFPEAGYATLRSTKNDLTVVMKFGPHGGAHGHFDKLNFVLYSHGQTLAVDPGTFPYGIPIHREWDSMTIAHNTISVDQERQSAATGKLLEWHVGKDWVAVRADAGAAYKTARLQRTIMLTPNYVLISDRCASADGRPHTYDWAYHNLGTESLTNSLDAKPFTFTVMNGYQHLTESMRQVTSDAIRLRFVDQKQQRAGKAQSESNSTPATYQAGASVSPDRSAKIEDIDVDLAMLPAGTSEVITGKAPSRSSQSPVPFVIVRRSGMSVNFSTLLTFRAPMTATRHQGVEFAEPSPGRYRIDGPGFCDNFFTDGNFDVHSCRRDNEVKGLGRMLPSEEIHP